VNNDDPTFPPLLAGHPINDSENAMAAAVRGIGAGQFGAGDVVWSRAVPKGELAIVLEPECPLSQALQMVPLALVASGDCLGALAPPQVAVTFGWPGDILVNGAQAGQVSAAWPAAAARDDVPDWLVVGFQVALMHDAHDMEPGMMPEVTVLAEEGCEELTRGRLIGSYSRHFLTWLNIWQDDGFRPVHDAWMVRAEGREEDKTYHLGGREIRGRTLGLDEEGNLLLKPGDGPARSLGLGNALKEAQNRKRNGEG